MTPLLLVFLLLVPALSLSEVGEDLREFVDDDVVVAERRRRLHAGAVCLAADHGRRQVLVMIVKVKHVGHAAWQEEVVALDRTLSRQSCSDDVPTWQIINSSTLVFGKNKLIYYKSY